MARLRLLTRAVTYSILFGLGYGLGLGLLFGVASGLAIGVTFAIELNRSSKRQDHYSLPLGSVVQRDSRGGLQRGAVSSSGLRFAMLYGAVADRRTSVSRTTRGVRPSHDVFSNPRATFHARVEFWRQWFEPWATLRRRSFAARWCGTWSIPGYSRRVWEW